MTAIGPPLSPDDDEIFVNGSVRIIEDGEPHIDDETLVVPDAIGSIYGNTILNCARYHHSDDFPIVNIVYGSIRTVRLFGPGDDEYAVIVDVEFDKNNDGQMWQRAYRETYPNLETALDHYIDAVKNRIVEVSIFDR